MLSHNESFIWPETLSLYRNISKEFRLAFISAFILGIIIHLYVITNLLLTGDSVTQLYEAGAGLRSGRWALHWVAGWTPVQTPTLNGVLSIFALSVTSALTVYVLKLSHPVSIVLTSAFIVSFPSIAGIFAYMFTADAYFIALLLNALAAYMAKRYRFGWIVATVLIAIACGIYQAFLCYAVGLLLFDCILSLFEEFDIKQVLFCGIKYIFTLIGGLLLYYVILHVLLKATGTKLTTYQGMDTMGSFSLTSYIAAIPKAYSGYKYFFLRWPFDVPGVKFAHFAVPFISFLCIAFIGFHKKLWKKPLRVICLMLGIALCPLALNLMAVLVYKGGVHRLMIYAFVLPFVFFIKLVERSVQLMIETNMTPVLWKGSSIVGILLCCLLIWNNTVICNTFYHELQYCYETTYSLATRIVTHVEDLDGFTADTPVMYIGTGELAKRKTPLFGAKSRHDKYVGFFDASYNLLFSSAFVENILNTYYPTPSVEAKAKISASEEARAMPVYPAKGSIDYIDGVVVVKLTEG